MMSVLWLVGLNSVGRESGDTNCFEWVGAVIQRFDFDCR